MLSPINTPILSKQNKKDRCRFIEGRKASDPYCVGTLRGNGGNRHFVGNQGYNGQGQMRADSHLR